jgi:hypothetical protein
MLRLAAWRLCEISIVPCMLIHDGLLLEARDTHHRRPHLLRHRPFIAVARPIVEFLICIYSDLESITYVTVRPRA